MGIRDSRFYKMLVKDDEKEEGSIFMGIFIGLFAAFGGILYGYDTGTISGILAMPYVLKEFPANKESFTSSEDSLIVSILSAGTFIGAIFAPYMGERFGRRFTIIVATCIVFNIGVILQVASTSIPLLCVGRVIGGLGVGLISSMIPLYQSETVPKWIRGAVVSCYQFAITIGLLLASCINQGTHLRNDSGSYRIPLSIQLLWSLILGVGMIFLPESPRFFVKTGKAERAIESLATIRRLPADHPQILKEYEEIKANYDYEMSVGASSWIDCFRTSNSQLKRLITGVFLQAFQQLTGINFIFYFGTTFFKNSGIKNSFIISVITNVVNVVMTVPGIFLVEILGRRAMLMYGAIGMCVSDFIIAIVGVTTDSAASNKVMIAFVCTFIASFAATWGPICWVVVGEIFPLRLRGKCVAMSSASNWLWNFGIAYATPYLVNTGKGNAGLQSKVFFIWGGFNLACLVFCFYFVYESKGLSLEQVDEMYEVCDNAWTSHNFVPTKNGFSQHLNDKETVNHLEKGDSEVSV
ncbi:hypothetical protein BABINDRAFT_40375 [Babjeviella inositovora NRRL Y-12698]|uniref:Major facilitator superfamily (MFS) profile domain-containing protein n=1 Tax=Babjeviella inositovora NRRL Y-12698 TaxID=984486 RepID=A0A1E3QK49_9ASCO|nr:uncharacterized protein BABINDRAFT_40375 [Babjeviella inositovora NRRL Y-12698]ODQ78063.1 hypothetical protein BABINDRAFT_40375 [Babjeviella inositovora NRRL Y-12698]